MPRGDGRLTHDLDPHSPGPQDACGVFGVWAPGEEVAKLTYYGLYLSDLGSRLLGTWAGHNGLEIGFLAAGVLFAVPILTVGPGPVHPTHLGRMLDVFAEMGDDVVDRFGVIGHRHQFQADVGVFAGIALP